MDLEELEPRKSKDYEIGGDLSNLSIEELKALVAKLTSEIVRIEDAVRAKESSMSAADSVFKT
ncbi:MAG: DUF1192 domain-containing protein [Hyphomicrobiales bacterium]|nr:DUF1192 domain-containing protein [Hyphomicrobiales bacterium]